VELKFSGEGLLNQELLHTVFQGFGGKEGLKLMSRAAREFGLSIITEVMSVEQVDLVAEYADILQVGARNMQNFMLLKELGRIKKTGNAKKRHVCDHRRIIIIS